MAFELRTMRWAIAAANHRSLRRAAEALNIRQSTLSRALSELERDLGATIFERSNGGTRTTVEGQEFITAARRVIDEFEELAIRLRMRARGECGRLVIGVHASLTAGNLRATLVDHHRRFPDVDTILVDGSGDRLACDVGAGAVDIAFVADGNRLATGKSLPVWSERVVLALPEVHPLRDKAAIHWRDLAGQSVLVPERGVGPEYLSLLSSKIGGHDACDIRRHNVALDRLLTLVGAGMGLLLALEGATGLSYPGVAFREMNGDDGPTRLCFHAIWRPENSNPSLSRLLDLLRERYPDLSAEPPLL